ncbi:glycosyl hydrolase [uncultured Algibacter sp.]|uniref:glycosyl hydrolase n=1 Tax=uncultured Algibacter sp. TaxID=298659 RepID=UPI00260A5A8E|nr:glycosyl hydrolase [uncultured Algibacter sp.]
MKYFKFLVVTLLLFSCSSDSDEEVFLSSNKSLFSFSIEEMPSLVFSGLSQNKLEATLEDVADLSQLTAVFTVSEGASVYIGNTKQQSGVTKNNFNSTVTYIIEAEDESRVEFTVLINPKENTAPVADAGDNQIAFLGSGGSNAQVTLDASASSDADGDTLTYEWKIDNSVVGSSEIVQVDLALGNYTVELTVTDGKGGSDTAIITVEVKELPVQVAIDLNASAETQNLLTNLVALTASNQFAFGQEFPLSFKLNGLSFDLNTSDCKDVSGDHPGVFGIDPHYMLYKGAAERQLHIDEAKAAYDNGAIVTFDFHQRSRTDGKIYYNEMTTDTDKSLVYDIVNDLNTAKAWYFSEIDEVLDIINNDLGFPVVFRPLHEMNGNWFWWGTNTLNHSPSLYIDLYRLTVDYVKDRTNNVLFAWSPNWDADEAYYPGDDYVDVVGVDYYEATKTALGQSLRDLTTFAAQHNKVAALTETGDQGFVSTNPDFWTDNILSVIEDGGNDIRLAWVLGWFNAPWDNSQDNLFIPNASSSQNAKDDFVAFKNNSNVLFQEEVKALNVYSSSN